MFIGSRSNISVMTKSCLFNHSSIKKFLPVCRNLCKLEPPPQKKKKKYIYIYMHFRSEKVLIDQKKDFYFENRIWGGGGEDNRIFVQLRLAALVLCINTCRSNMYGRILYFILYCTVVSTKSLK